MKRPAFQFYPADWRKDTALQSCSLTARGLWHEMLCIMHECEPYGHLSVNGKPMKHAQVARLAGVSEKEYRELLQELTDAGVPSVDENGCIYSRRMVRDEHIRNVRAASGKKGGNPNLVGNKVNQNHNQDDSEGLILLNQTSKQSPTPSSSSSNKPLSLSDANASSRDATPSRKTTFAVWLKAVKAAGEKPISDYQPVWSYAQTVGLPDDWIHIAWLKFVERYRDDADSKRKRYIDWRRVFLRAIQDNWFGLWYAKDGEFQLTTVGHQADIATREVA